MGRLNGKGNVCTAMPFKRSEMALKSIILRKASIEAVVVGYLIVGASSRVYASSAQLAKTSKSSLGHSDIAKAT